MHDDLVIPASYEVWLSDLKHHLDRTPGSKAVLARHLVAMRDWKPTTASAFVTRLVQQKVEPAAGLFIDIAAWLQQQTGGRDVPVQLEPTDDLPPRREVRYTTGSKQRPAKVAEE